MKPSDFPSLEKAATAATSTGYQLASYARALEWLDDGTAQGAIRNTYLDTCKHVLGRLVERAWSDTKKQIDYSGRHSWPEPLKKLFDNLFISGLHDVVVANNKLQKTKAVGPQVDVLRDFVNEVLPLALAAAELKSKVIKGREPSKGPVKPENPNKIVKQCACCFRDIAVGPKGTMAHHGYERPGDGSQTASCWGIAYQPLDVSTAGLEYVISMLEKHIADKKAYRQHLETATSIARMKGFKVEKLSKGDLGFDWALQMEKMNTEQAIRWQEDRLLVCRHVLVNWKPGQSQTIPVAFELKREEQKDDRSFVAKP